jgi:hypothetical protein
MTPLRQRMVEDMRIRNLSANTQRAYLQQVGAFAKHFGRSPATLGAEEIRAWHCTFSKSGNSRAAAWSPRRVVQTHRQRYQMHQLRRRIQFRRRKYRFPIIAIGRNKIVSN